MSDSLQPHRLSHARLLCPPLSPGVFCSDSCPLSLWYYLTISSSVVPFSSCPQSLPASKAFPMSQPFAWGGQSTGASASEAAVLPRNIQALISFRMDWLGLIAAWRTLKSLLQHHSWKASILRRSAFFMVQLSHPYMTAGETIALNIQTFAGKAMSLLFSMLSSFVLAFLPRSKHL